MSRILNRTACSPEFLTAFDAVESGKASARRASWPPGMAIKLHEGHGGIVVVRPGSAVQPPWQGPSSAESDATDWVVCDAPPWLTASQF